MSAHCCEHDTPKPAALTNLPRYRRILWIAMLVNAAMLVVELAAATARARSRCWPTQSISGATR
jgi:hypothetical protein